MSYFLIYAILSLLLILLKISSQSQNNISFNAKNEPDINLNLEMKDIIKYIKEVPDLIKALKDGDSIIRENLRGFTDEEKNLTIKIKNDLFNNHYKYVEDLVNMIKKIEQC